MSSNRLVQVSRNGKTIGQYPPEQLASLMDTGQFLDTDLCCNEAFPDWTPLPEFLNKIEAPRYSRADQVEGGDSAEEEEGAWRRHRSRHGLGALISGWIAFLLALAALCGAGFWIAGLYSELGHTSFRIGEMEKKLVEKEKENQRLLFVSRELAEPGTVRGSMVLRNESGKRNAMPGVQIFLYPRKVIESYLNARWQEAKRLPEGSNVDANAFFTANLPSPLATTTTDASGRFEFSVPEPGEYVLHAGTGVITRGEPVRRIWFVSFNSQDPLNTIVELTDTNFVQQFDPSLMVVQGR